MGRAERRRQERLNKIESRKGKFLVSKEEMEQIRERQTYEAAEYDVVALLTCFAMAEHKIHNMDSDQIAESLSYINELMDDVTNGKSTFEEYRRILEDEVGIVVACE